MFFGSHHNNSGRQKTKVMVHTRKVVVRGADDLYRMAAWQTCKSPAQLKWCKPWTNSGTDLNQLWSCRDWISEWSQGGFYVTNSNKSMETQGEAKTKADCGDVGKGKGKWCFRCRTKGMYHRSILPNFNLNHTSFGPSILPVACSWQENSSLE
jgi:hypothetical protein